ncbi:MAG: hypothetical protein ACRDPZ_11860 [Gaiellaceae bacterium]
MIAPLVGSLGLVLAANVPGHRGAPAWTEAKAERAVLRDATVAVPPPLKAALRVELLALIPRYRMLEQLAWQGGDHQSAGRIHNLRYRYSTALRKLEDGLRVTATDCAGAGRAVGDGRFRHFECSATSEPLEIPTADVVYGDDDALPAVTERDPRRYGPFQARLLVHVRDGSPIAFRQVSVARLTLGVSRARTTRSGDGPRLVPRWVTERGVRS